MNGLLKNGLHCRIWAEMLGYGTKCRIIRDEMLHISGNNLKIVPKKETNRMK
jgi:hypothetical protein